MIEAVIGVVGVLVGVGIIWVKDWWSSEQSRKKNARYLAIRIVCVLDQYAERCVEAVRDDGLSFGWRNSKGCLEPQVQPPPPSYPADVDWTSINQDLMYRTLSLPSQAEASGRLVDIMFLEFSDPPDYETGFEESRLQYARLGLLAFEITKDFRESYNIPPRDTDDKYPAIALQEKINEIEEMRVERENEPTLDFDVDEGESI